MSLSNDRFCALVFVGPAAIKKSVRSKPPIIIIIGSLLLTKSGTFTVFVSKLDLEVASDGLREPC